MTLLRDEHLAAAFDHAARSYDTLVAANPGYHAHLRRSARRLGLPRGGRACACSTSAAAPAPPPARSPRCCRAPRSPPWTPPPMLERAAAKTWPPNVTFVHAPAERLAEAGVTGPFDAVFAAYLFRNVTDPDAVLRTVHGLLAPGGRLAVHEYTLGGRRTDRAVWTLVCRGVVQPVATLLGDGDLYRHLWRSVVEFDTADRFAHRLEANGFDRVRRLPLPGWQTGITHTFTGRRPTTTRDRAMTRPPRPTAARRGRDRRARVIMPAPGAPRVDGDHRPSTAVVGGGIAGLAAATALAERGVDVTLYEARPTSADASAAGPST